jgi:hypothetical protein
MTSEQLQQDPSYNLLLMLPHDDLLPFLQEQISARSKTMRYFLALNALLIAGMAVIAVLDVRQGLIGWSGILKNFGLGTLLVFTILIAVHEGIHGLAYKMAGAPEISFGVSWRKFYFYAVANKFIVNHTAFLLIALAPFAVISAVVIGGLFFADVWMKWVLLTILFMHTGACAGDFAMLAFYEKHRHLGKILTFDDVDKKISYFYVKD